MVLLCLRAPFAWTSCCVCPASPLFLVVPFGAIICGSCWCPSCLSFCPYLWNLPGFCLGWAVWDPHPTPHWCVQRIHMAFSSLDYVSCSLCFLCSYCVASPTVGFSCLSSNSYVFQASYELLLLCFDLIEPYSSAVVLAVPIKLLGSVACSCLSSWWSLSPVVVHDNKNYALLIPCSEQNGIIPAPRYNYARGV